MGPDGAPGGGDQSMHLVSSCSAQQGGVYQDLSGFVLGITYRLTVEAVGQTFSNQEDWAFSTMSDAGGSNIWAQDFFVTAPKQTWRTHTFDFVGQSTTGRLRIETATQNSCVNIDNVRIDPVP